MTGRGVFQVSTDEWAKRRSSRSRLLVLLGVAFLTGGCTRAFETDGSPEAELVRDWYSPDWVAGGNASSLVEPDARLVLSDFAVPLTRGALRIRGPDGVRGCERSTIGRFGYAIRMTWSCRDKERPQRYVDVQLRNGRIVSVSYVEEYQARLDNPSARLGTMMGFRSPSR